jgi:tRNA nucleotidyltransferase (CCA-adding enzyme)
LRGCPPQAALVYAVLFSGREPEDAFKAMNALRFDKALCRKTSLLIKWFKTPIVNQDYALRKYLSLCGVSYFQDILALKRIMKTPESDILPLISERYERIIKNADCLNVRDLRVNGDDLLSMGLSGKAIGEALNLLLDQVLRDPSLNSKAMLLNALTPFF